MKIIVAGDFCPQHRVEGLFEKSEFDAVLSDVKPIVEQADYSIVNLECPVCYGEEKPILKSGPNLSCTEKGVEAVKWTGFDCVTLANNHFLDFGVEGVDNTLAACKKCGLDIVGGGRNLKEASQILYKEIGGSKLAIINCCEHEFSIATDTTAGSNPLNPIQQYYAIKEASRKADYVLVIVHGGHEHYQLPSTRMQETYRFFIDAGADAVVNHHQHCYSGYEWYNDKIIVYGLGNFCFDKGKPRNKEWHEGYMISLDFIDSDINSFKILPYVQCSKNASVQLMNELQNSDFISNIDNLNKIINEEKKLEEEHRKLLSEQQKNYNFMFSPWDNRYTVALFNRRLLPRFISRKKSLMWYNYLVCASHRDNLIKSLKNYLF